MLYLPITRYKIYINNSKITIHRFPNKTSRPLDDNMQYFQGNKCLKFIDFKGPEIHKGKNNYFQWKKGVKMVLKT
ncbi:MAG: hypothetical protein ACI9OE_001419 [Mariniflexile sp.]